MERHQDSYSSCFGKRPGSVKKHSKGEDDYEGRTYTYPKSTKGFELKNNRSLPRTHKLQENQRQQKESDFLTTTYLPTETPTAFKDRPYEMILCPQTVTTDVQFAQNRALDDRMYMDTPIKSSKIVKQYSLTSADKKVIYTFDYSSSYQKVTFKCRGVIITIVK